MNKFYYLFILNLILKHCKKINNIRYSEFIKIINKKIIETNIDILKLSLLKIIRELIVSSEEERYTLLNIMISRFNEKDKISATVEHYLSSIVNPDVFDKTKINKFYVKNIDREIIIDNVKYLFLIKNLNRL
jgi:hypothetical protein